MSFAEKYEALEREFKRQADSDGDVFIPRIAPSAPVDYVLIGSEPSFFKWASSKADAQRKVDLGYKNSATTLEDFCFHYAVRKLLCTDGETYYVTDLSHGAMPVKVAKGSRTQQIKRYDRWSLLLRRELELVSKPTAHLFAIGADVCDYLGAIGIHDTRLIQFGGSGVAHWKKTAAETPDAYQAFIRKMSPTEITATAGEVLTEAGMDRWIDQKVESLKVSESRNWLIFTYNGQIGRWRRRTQSGCQRASAHCGCHA